MDRIGIFSPRRRVGTTLLAAHLFHYLREHGVHCCGSDEKDQCDRPAELATRWGIPQVPRRYPCFETLPRTPGGLGVGVYDVHSERRGFEYDALGCYRWVILMNDEASFEEGIAVARRMWGTVICVWNGADDALRRRITLSDDAARGGRITIATSAIPRSELIRRADEAAMPVWCLPGGARSAGGRAMVRVLREILGQLGPRSELRHIGAEPPELPRCGRCLLCERWLRQSTASTALAPMH